jgi:hypothetical protein
MSFARPNLPVLIDEIEALMAQLPKEEEGRIGK